MILDKLKAYGWMAAAITAGVLLGVQTLRLHTSQLDAATTRTAHADTLRTIADLTAKAERAVRAEETQRAQALEKIANDTQKQIDAARADAATAARAADSLRGQLARYIAAARAGGPGASTAAPGPATSDPLDLLSGMFQGADQVAGELAEGLDRARAAGLACERAYDALSAGSNDRRATAKSSPSPSVAAVVLTEAAQGHSEDSLLIERSWPLSHHAQ